MLDLNAIRLQWEPLSGSDTNGPHTATANTIVELLALIEAQQKNIEDLETVNERLTRADDAKVTKLAATINVGEAITETGKETSPYAPTTRK